MIGIKDRGRLPERQVTLAKSHRLQDYERADAFHTWPDERASDLGRVGTIGALSLR